MRNVTVSMIAALLAGCGGGIDEPSSAEAASAARAVVAEAAAGKSGCELLTDAEVGQWRAEGNAQLMLAICSSRAVIRLDIDNSKQTVAQDKEGLIALARSVLGRL